MPRILVSEDGGCVNLMNEAQSEFSSARFGKVKRAKDHNESSPSPSRQQLTTAGTLYKKLYSRGQPMQEGHSQYLLELMRPFAN